MFLLSPSAVLWTFIGFFLFSIVAERVAMVSAKGARALRLTAIPLVLAHVTPFLQVFHVPLPSFVYPLLHDLPTLCFAAFWCLLAWAVVEVAKTVSTPGGLR
jgi:hypothetical protein